MNLPRRRFLLAAAGAAALPMLPAAAAELYPSRPVHFVVGFAPGGSADITARLFGQWLSERLGQQFVIENRVGAGTNLATDAVINAPPDGYTILMVTGSNFINATLYQNMKFNFVRDIEPVVNISYEPNVLVVHPSVPVNSLAELIAYTKANPGLITMASGGNGAPSHISGEMFKMLAGVDMTHVPYRGAGPALVGLLAGQAQVYFAPLTAAVEYIKAGKMRALAVTTEKRSAVLPDLPTIAELVPGYEASQAYGIGAPRHTPPEIIAKLNATTNAVLGDPAVKARLAALGQTPLGGTAAAFGKVIADETERWGKVVKFSGAKVD